MQATEQSAAAKARTVIKIRRQLADNAQAIARHFETDETTPHSLLAEQAKLVSQLRDFTMWRDQELSELGRLSYRSQVEALR